MQKNWKLTLALAILLGLSATISITAQAKTTWHKGTPTALRGYWIYAQHKPKHTSLGFAEYFKITRNSVDKEASGMPSTITYNPYYRKSANYYYIKGKIKKIGGLIGGTSYYKFHKTGSKTFWLVPKHKGERAYKKITHLRNWY